MSTKWERIWAASSGHNFDQEQAKTRLLNAQADNADLLGTLSKDPELMKQVATAMGITTPADTNVVTPGIKPNPLDIPNANAPDLVSSMKTAVLGTPDTTQEGAQSPDLATSLKAALIAGQLRKKMGVSGTAASNATPEEINNTAQGIISGKIPPDRKYYRDTLRVDAELQKQGFNMSDASQEWTATHRFLNSMNSEKQVRLRQAISSVKDALGGLEGLNQEMTRSNFAPLNKAQLAIQANSGNPLATKFLGQINIIQDELGQVFMGGNSPTERALELAAQTLKGNWSQDQLKAAMDNVRANLGYRENAINHASVQGVGSKENQGAGSRYLPAKNNPMDGTEMPHPGGGEQETVTGRVKVKSSDGKIGSIPVNQLQDALAQGYQEVQ